jgi:methionyl-tRNA synthetase
MEHELVANLQAALVRYTGFLDGMQLRRAAAELKEIWTLGNVYLDRAAPWTTIKTDRDRTAVILRVAINLVRFYAIVGAPIIPDTCNRLRASLGIDAGDDYWPADAAAELRAVPAGHAFTVPAPLFKKIAPEEIADLTRRYGGEEAAAAD